MLGGRAAGTEIAFRTYWGEIERSYRSQYMALPSAQMFDGIQVVRKRRRLGFLMITPVEMNGRGDESRTGKWPSGGYYGDELRNRARDHLEHCAPKDFN